VGKLSQTIALVIDRKSCHEVVKRVVRRVKFILKVMFSPTRILWQIILGLVNITRIMWAGIVKYSRFCLNLLNKFFRFIDGSTKKMIDLLLETILKICRIMPIYEYEI